MSQLLKREAFSLPKLGTINIHPSYLPEYRGPNPWYWQYHNLEKEGGVSIHYVDDGEDSGDIIAREKYSIEPGELFPSVFSKATNTAQKLFAGALHDIETGKVSRITQKDLSCGRRASLVKPDDRFVKWNEWPIERCWHVLRGTTNWVTEIESPTGWKKKLGWKIGRFVKAKTDKTPGHIYKDSRGYFVAHPEGEIRIGVNYNFKSILKLIAYK
jgi:methionyl-tRNA formyltransferase